MDKSLKYLVGISAIVIAGCAAYFSITGLGILFAGASVSVMVMAGSLEYAKLVTATYLKQKWDVIKGFNKWYLTISVIILMGITSAGIFGYLSNAFQQQNIKLDQVAREIQVWQNKIDNSNQQILTLQGQQKDLSTTQNTLITKGNVNSRLLRSVDNRDRQTNTINKKINVLQDSIVSYNGYINNIKNNNIELEREVGGFRFVAEAFGMSLNSVVKFFIFLIVIVFDPLAIALVIAFNQLVLGENKKEEEVEVKEDKTKDIIEEESRLKLSKEDLKILESVLLNPPPPNDNLKDASKIYKEEIKSQPTQEERHEILVEMMKNDEELGLYDESFDNSTIKKDNIDLKEIVEKLQDKEELFPESNQRAKEIIENSNWDVTLMDGLEDEEPFFTEEEIENILQEEPTEEEIERNFSTIEPNTENISQDDDYLTDAIREFNQESIEEDDFDGFVPEPFATPEEVEELKIDVKIEIPEDDERMNIIGQNGNEGLHYENEETTSSEQDDEKKN
jgi:hypothetical protein